MRKVGAVKGSASPASGADSTGGETMRRTGSGGGGQSSGKCVASTERKSIIDHDSAKSTVLFIYS